ncbi:methionyl-tRNA formyltransferase [Macrococcus epidermidis]|uniref:formyltransferase family protein n=1 Tax=Macrococcus epidermidis TaxID=1902580 RepID=UPI001EF2C67A|nr:formyltransferase family protein [Macrococcus epidermidis]MCG7421124.1 methionyl-tRNA formyltransferase [Macrococcus epidermidis]
MYKTAFVTCVKLGKSCIKSIIESGGKFDLLITLEDEIDKDKSGRIYLDDISKKFNIPLLKIKNINDEFTINALKEYKIDWLFIIGWSQIAKKELLNIPKEGCIGMHPTLLPIGRGRASIPWAIIHGLDETGVTMFKLDEGVDTGDIIDQGHIILDDEIDATELYQKVNDLHVELMKRNWNKIINNDLTLTKQEDKKSTYWPGRKPKDGEITKNMSMLDADRLVRATTKPYPGAFFIDNNKKIIIWSAEMSPVKGDIQLKDGYLKLKEYEVEIYE